MQSGITEKNGIQIDKQFIGSKQEKNKILVQLQEI